MDTQNIMRKKVLIIENEKPYKEIYRETLAFVGNASMVKNLERCFKCRKKIRPDEVPMVIHMSGVGKRFICQRCADKEKEKNERS